MFIKQSFSPYESWLGFNWKDFRKDLETDLSSLKAMKTPSYIYNTPSTSVDVFTKLFYPLYKTCRLFHYLAGKVIVPSSSYLAIRPADLAKKRMSILNNPQFKQGYLAKRESFLVNGEKIDAILLGNKNWIHNKRWIVLTNSNALHMEDYLDGSAPGLYEKIEHLKTNVLLFNYQGVGASEGVTTRNGMIAAHLAAVRFLEEKINANQIIRNGVSIGAAIQNEGFKDVKPNIEYVSLDEQTFSSLSKVSNRFFGWCIRALGWELNAEDSSRKLPFRQVIVQTCKQAKAVVCDDPAKRIRKPSDIKKDGVISQVSSLAYALLSGSSASQIANKVFVGVFAKHCEEYSPLEKQTIYKEVLKGFTTSSFF